jgi:hypothetical protein
LFILRSSPNAHAAQALVCDLLPKELQLRVRSTALAVDEVSRTTVGGGINCGFDMVARPPQRDVEEFPKIDLILDNQDPIGHRLRRLD